MYAAKATIINSDFSETSVIGSHIKDTKSFHLCIGIIVIIA